MKSGARQASATVSETECQYIVNVDVRGFTRRDLTVELDGRVVTVAGESRLLDVLEESFRLPDDVDPQHVVVYFDRGVLEIHAPKRGTRARRRVPVIDKPHGLRWTEAEATAHDHVPIGLGMD
jgi:HSP20 family protein